MPPLKRRQKRVLALAISQSIAAISHAATITVNLVDDATADDDFCTLREAINQANREGNPPLNNGCANGENGPDTIILPSSTVFTVSISQVPYSTFSIESDITIEGFGSTITIAASELRHFSVPATPTYGRLSLNNITLNGGNLSDPNSLGGAINAAGGVILKNTTVSGNTAGSGGGVFSSGKQLDVDRSKIINNSATATNSASCRCGKGGGGILFERNWGLLTIRDSEVTSNYSRTHSGGVRAQAINFDKKITLSITNSTISENKAELGGGGFSTAYNGVVTVSSSAISRNRASASGAFFTGRESIVTLSDSTISGNSARFEGGFSVYYSIMRVRNSTISNNTASEGVGAFSLYVSQQVILENSTISENSSNTGAAGFSLKGFSTLTLRNSIVANPNGADCAIGTSYYENYSFGEARSAVLADQSNIIEDGSCDTNAAQIDPRLLPLADNGGPTLTHALAPDSPAIDMGRQNVCDRAPISGLDQRGFIRTNQCDIGAFEFGAVPQQSLNSPAKFLPSIMLLLEDEEDPS